MRSAALGTAPSIVAADPSWRRRLRQLVQVLSTSHEADDPVLVSMLGQRGCDQHDTIMS